MSNGGKQDEKPWEPIPLITFTRKRKATWFDILWKECLLSFLEKPLAEIHVGVTDSEIKNVIFSMGLYKTPRFDGLHVVFFQSQ